MDDIDFESLARQIIIENSMDEVNDILKDYAKKNPKAVGSFTLGRMIGRLDITSKLIKIIEDDARNSSEYIEFLKGKKNE